MTTRLIPYTSSYAHRLVFTTPTCGVLGYLAHDEERENPVHFQWQLLDWPMPAGAVQEMGLVLTPATSSDSGADMSTPADSVPNLTLSEVPPPAGTKPGAATSRDFKAKKMALHPDQDARNRAIGLAGEQLVLAAEQGRLTAAGRPDLAEKVVHVSVVEGDGAGYDIRSFDESGDIRHLEVKTTRNGIASGFFASPNEIAFSQGHASTFILVRVFGYDPKTKSGSCYRCPGALTETFSLVASEYRASPKP
jgi:Protein NO VEIN, C-terminal